MLDRIRQQVPAKQFQIFDLYVVKNWPAREVAQSLGVSLAAVYVAKHRIAKLIAREIKALSE